MDSVKKEDVVKSEVIETEKVDEEKTVIKSISGMLFIQIIICLWPIYYQVKALLQETKVMIYIQINVCNKLID